MKLMWHGHVKTAIDSVRGSKMRNFWTMLGVIIGVASVISVVAIGQGIKQQIAGQLHNFGKDLIIVKPAQLKTGSDAGTNSQSALSGLSISAPLSAKDVLVATHVTNLAASAPLTITPGTPQINNQRYKDGFVIGTTADLPSLLNQSLAHGSFLVDEETDNFAVLGPDAAQKMFDEDVPLGHTFDFHGQTFIVKGIFNHFNTAPLSQQVDFNRAVFIPNSIAERLTNNTAPTYEILARAKSANQTSMVAHDIRVGLNKTHGGDGGYSVVTGDKDLENNSAILDLLTRLIAGVAAISLLVGGIGIMNVMLVSVAERTHEIGIRKAVGATNRQILSQFMIESSLISVTGGVIGIVIAALVDIGLRVSTSLKPIINWQIVLIAAGVSLAVGVIFGTVPAIKAARKDPIEALRSD